MRLSDPLTMMTDSIINTQFKKRVHFKQADRFLILDIFYAIWDI